MNTALTQNICGRLPKSVPFAPHQDKSGDPEDCHADGGHFRKYRPKAPHHLCFIDGQDEGAPHDNGAGEATGGTEHQAHKMQKKNGVVHFRYPLLMFFPGRFCCSGQAMASGKM